MRDNNIRKVIVGLDRKVIRMYGYEIGDCCDLFL